MRTLVLFLLSCSAGACATTERCTDVAPHTRFSSVGWSASPVRAFTVVVHNPEAYAISATLDCTSCDGSLRQVVHLGPHEHMPVLLAQAPEGCACNLEQDTVLQ